jgi:hypothetical protein
VIQVILTELVMTVTVTSVISAVFVVKVMSELDTVSAELLADADLTR